MRLASASVVAFFLLAGQQGRAQLISISPPLRPAAAGAQGEPDSNSYLYDDGSVESGASAGIDLDICWIHSFDAVGGMDTIVRVSTAFGVPGFPGTSPPNGTPVRICVWEDPNEDGDPTDAVLMAEVVDQLKQGATGVIVDYDVPPTPVVGTFFVGVILSVNPSHIAAPVDLSTPLFNLAWVAAAIPPGSFDAKNLALNALPPVTLSSLGADVPWVLRAEGFAPPTAYCTAKTNSLGCVPAIAFSGQPDPNSNTGFRVFASNVRSQRPGILLYSIDGRAAEPFQGGVLCLAAPLRRTPVIHSGGNAGGVDCSGVWMIDMNGFAHGTYGGSPAPELLVEGTVVNAQWWGRDLGDPAGFASSLTDAIEYVVPPGQPMD
jgi:hypothetical protein